LPGAPGKGTGPFDEVLEDHFNANSVTEPRGVVKGPVRTAEHGMDTGEPPTIANGQAVKGIQHGRRGQYRAPASRTGVVSIEPQGIVIANGLSPMSNGVTRGLRQIGRRSGDLLP